MTTETIIKVAGAVRRWLKANYMGQNGFMAACTIMMALCIGVGLIIANLPFVVRALSGGARVQIVESRIDTMQADLMIERKEAAKTSEEIKATLVDIKSTLRGEVANNAEWRAEISRQLSELRAPRVSGGPYYQPDRGSTN